ncbi:MAG: glycosyltransferase, partial [Brachybacterium sp.]|nr:glycosyltransferase [Brachybacterium sp.]
MSTTTAPATTDAPESTEQRILQRMIMPLQPTPDIVPLYIEQQSARTAATSTGLGLGSSSLEATSSQGPAAVQATEHVGSEELDNRYSVTVPAHGLRSLGTYFNAFPASYWRRWTPVRQVRLRLETIGRAQIVVYRSNARGNIQRQDFANVVGSAATVFDLPLTAFGDGGWYWFDVHAGDEDVTVVSASWSADAEDARTRGTISLGMTTMNKVDYCLDNIRAIAENDEVRRLLDVMYVVDQGSDRLTDHAEQLDPLREAMGDQLEIIEQGNIGGSGGFSRGMYETAMAGRSAYVVNLDDDIVIEPETLVRMVTFADYASTPTIVGAHMFDLNNRSVLHTFGEIVDPWRMLWVPAEDDTPRSHDFGAYPLRSTPALHRRTDVDFNGWWMCLIPVETIREIGLSLPVFIKWDDAEYGLRAKAAGYPTVSLPGAGVWHVSWVDKDDSVGWQAYFHERNRMITGLLHSPFPRGGRLLKESVFQDLKHLISMQYSTEHLRLMAQQDLLAGPGVLHAEIGSKLGQIRAAATGYADATAKSDAAQFPATGMDKPPKKRHSSQPSRALLPAWAAKTVATQVLRPVRSRATRNPETTVAHQDAKWWRLARHDSALVSNAEGTTVAWYRRDPRTVRSMLTGAAQTHQE